MCAAHTPPDQFQAPTQLRSETRDGWNGSIEHDGLGYSDDGEPEPESEEEEEEEEEDEDEERADCEFARRIAEERRRAGCDE